MKPRFTVWHCRSWFLATAGLTLLASPGRGEPFDGLPKILLHLAPATDQDSCGSGQLDDCVGARVNQWLAPAVDPPRYLVYLLAARGDLTGVAGLQCAIYYQQNCTRDMNDRQGIDILDWRLCADYEVFYATPNTWPQPGSTNRITWDSPGHCQPGETAVAGYFYVSVYGPDQMRVYRPEGPLEAQVIPCTGPAGSIGRESVGVVSFWRSGGYIPACNPCRDPCWDFNVPYVPPDDCVPPPPPPPPPSPRPPEGRILLHVATPTSKNACLQGRLGDCTLAGVRGGLSTATGPFHFVYLLANKEPSAATAGLQCGITYDSGQPAGDANGSRIDIFSWILCGDLQFPTPGPNAWPKPGGGNLITWSCRTEETAVAGYFYLGAYASDVLAITPRPVDGAAKVADCDAAELGVPEANLGSAAFSAGATSGGCNPCVVSCASPIPVQATTWSAIKALISR